MNEQETITDIVAELRERGECRERSPVVYDYADRLEAAHKRERGDCAKLREALAKVIEITEREWNAFRETPAMWEIHEICKAALAAPPRNCDVLKLEEGHPGDIAEQVWRAYKHSHMGSYLDVCDLLRCIGWLFAPATEKEGGDK